MTAARNGHGDPAYEHAAGMITCIWCTRRPRPSLMDLGIDVLVHPAGMGMCTHVTIPIRAASPAVTCHASAGEGCLLADDPLPS